MRHARNRPKRVAGKLQQIREALGLSQKEMAERLGVYRTHHHISKYERGKAVPFMEVLLAYSRVVGVQMELIVDDTISVGGFPWATSRQNRGVVSEH
jgi:transcriptional regulator with XRE-family HTH domain